MGRGENTMGEWVVIPLVVGEIPWVGGSIYYGRGSKYHEYEGRYTMVRGSKYHG